MRVFVKIESVMTEPGLISVILPTKNRAGVLERSIRSVLDQTYENIELIVVDDASTDGTGELVNSIKEPRLRYVLMGESRGAAQARNIGIIQAGGALIAFQDSDDAWLPDKLRLQVQSLGAASDEAGVCVCSSRYTVRGRTAVTSHGDGEIDHQRAVRMIVDGAGYATPTILVKKEVFESVGVFDESLPRLQDYEFTLRAAAGGWNFVLMPQVLVNHDINVDSISYSADNYTRALGIIVEKHADLLRRYRAGHSRLIFRGGKYLAQENRYRAALPYFWKALRTNPFNVRALAGVVMVTTGIYPLFKRIKYGSA